MDYEKIINDNKKILEQLSHSINPMLDSANASLGKLRNDLKDVDGGDDYLTDFSDINKVIGKMRTGDYSAIKELEVIQEKIKQRAYNHTK